MGKIKGTFWNGYDELEYSCEYSDVGTKTSIDCELDLVSVREVKDPNALDIVDIYYDGHEYFADKGGDVPVLSGFSFEVDWDRPLNERDLKESIQDIIRELLE